MRTALAIAVSGLVVGCGITLGSHVARVTIAAAIAFTVACLVASARDPRRAGVLAMAIILPASVATGVKAAGPLPVSAVIPTAVFMITLIPGVCRGASALPRELWGLVVIGIFSVGGISATAAGGGSLTAIGGFIISTVPIIVAFWRLNPDRAEIHRLVAGMVAGVAISTVLGIAVLGSPNGRAKGLTHHPNQFALQIALALPLLGLLWAAGTVKTWLAAILVLVLVVGALDSGSRSGAISLALVVAVLLWRSIRPMVLLAIAAVVGCLVVLVGISSTSPTIARLTQSSLVQNSDTKRLALADKGLEQVRLDPVFGTGLPKTALPHNVILLVWGGMGFIGLVALVVLAWFIFSGSLGAPRGLERWLLSLAALGFFIVVSLNNSIGTPLAWAVLGLLQTSVVRAQRLRTPLVPEPAGPKHLRREVLVA